MRSRSSSQSYSCLPYFSSPPPPAFKYRHRIRYSPVRWCLPQLDGAVKNTCYQTCHFMCQLPLSTGGKPSQAPGLAGAVVSALGFRVGHVLVPGIKAFVALYQPKAGLRYPSVPKSLQVSFHWALLPSAEVGNCSLLLQEVYVNTTLLWPS